MSKVDQAERRNRNDKSASTGSASTFTRYKWLTFFAVIAVLLLFAYLSLSRGHVAISSAVTVTFVGYTNPPDSRLRFMLFSFSNQAPYAVRWRGSWVEIEGNPNHMSETVNRSLPGFIREPTLKTGNVLRLAIGEPLYDSENGRWRYVMSFRPYTWRERWFEFSLRHNFLVKIGALKFVDTQGMLNPSNNVTIAGPWLTK